MAITHIVHPVRLTLPPSVRIDGGPAFSTTDTETESGDIQTNLNWEYPLWTFTIQYRRASKDFVDVQGFFLARRGRAYGFFWKDPVDYKDGGHGKVRQIGSKKYLVKEYPDADNYSPFKRIITRPIFGTVRINGSTSGFTVNYTTGEVTGVAAVDGATATFEFDVPVKFATNACRPSYTPAPSGNELTDWVNVDLRELRNYAIAS